MNRKLASALSVASSAAAVFAAAAIASGSAYADDITIDDTPFVSTKTRAEVRAEGLRASEPLSLAYSEWRLQQSHFPANKSTYTRAEAKADGDPGGGKIMVSIWSPCTTA